MKKLVRIRVLPTTDIDPIYSDSVVVEISTDGGQSWNLHTAYRTTVSGKDTISTSVKAIYELQCLVARGYTFVV